MSRIVIVILIYHRYERTEVYKRFLTRHVNQLVMSGYLIDSSETQMKLSILILNTGSCSLVKMRANFLANTTKI
jgi:hypothetical protein